jgi:MFS family permease
MEVVSGVGDGVFWVGLVAIMLERNVGAVGFALAAAARLGPRALVSAPAGVLADRVDRRRLLASIDLVRAISMAVLAVATAADLDLGWLLAVVFVSYTIAAPYRPALTAALPSVAGESDLSKVNAVVSTTRQLMTFIGPVVGAVVVATASPSVAFWLNAGTFTIAAVLVAGARSVGGRPLAAPVNLTTHRGEWRRDLFGGWHDVRGTAGLGVIATLVFTMYVARGAELVLFALAAERTLGMGAAGTGVLTGAVGLGALVALPAAARIADVGRVDRVLVAAVLTTGVPLAVLAGLHSSVAACAALVVVGAGVVVFEVLSVVVLQRLARRDVMGRVFGVIGAASNAGKLLGAVLAPALVAVAQVSGAFLALGVGVTMIGIGSLPGLIALNRASRARRDQLRPLLEVLSGLRLFDGASPAALEQLASTIAVEEVPADHMVIRQGDRADDLYVVRSGHLTVVENGVVVNEMAPGDWFGEIGLVQRRRRTATVRADEPCVLWRIDGATFLQALEDGASASSALMEVMADRLARSRLAAPPHA